MWKCTQHTFAGGQQDLTLAGRQDLATYFTSARTLENFLVKRQGCISKRRGTELVANLDGLFGEGWKISHVRAIPFVYERDGGYVLLFVEGEFVTEDEVLDENGEVTKQETRTVESGIVICSSEGMLLKHTPAGSAAAGGQLPADYMWGDSPRVKATDENGMKKLFEVVILPIPYTGEDFNDIGYAQSGDTLFVAHEKYPFATIKRVGGLFEYSVVNFQELGASQQYYPPIITARAAGTEGTGAERTVSYVATYVKDGVESAPSSPVFIKYSSPWKETFVITITADKGVNKEEPDFYNIYKKSGADYGFIGSTVAAVEQRVPLIDSTENVKFGEYALSQTSASTVKVGNFSESSSSTVKKTIFNNGCRFDYYNGRMSLRGGMIAGSNDGITISFKKGTQFTDLEMTLGISSYFTPTISGWNNGGGFYVYADFLYNKPLDADSLVVELYVEAVKSDGSSYVPKNAFVSGSEYVPAISVPKVDKDRQIVLRSRTYKNSKLYSDTIASEGDVAAIFNKQYVKCSFEKAISTDTTLSAEGVTWWVNKIVIKAKKGDVYVAPMISYINCFYKNPVANYVNDDYITPDVSLTPPSNEPHFDAVGKYPSAVALKEQRLVLAATENQPFTLFFSTTGDLYNFNTHNTIRDDDAIEATIPATEFPEINHIVSARELLVLCDNGEWVVKPSSGNALTYRTLEIKQQSQIGCSKRLPPLSVGDEAIFAENTSETLRAIKYSWESDGFVSSDLSVLSQSITRNNPIIDYAYKQHPDSIIVCVLQDGTIATLTYMKEHEVCAWSTARLGGGLRAVGICTDKAIRGGTTDLYILATDASGVYSLLRVREDSPAATVEESLCLDAMQIVEVAEDAKEEELPTIPDGMVAYDLADGCNVDVLGKGHSYAVGYLYTAIFRSVTPEAQGQSTIQFELKGAKSAELRLENASAFEIIPTALERETGANYWTTCGDDVKVEDGKVTYSAQDHFVELAGDANTSGAITIKSDSPWPLSLLSYSINFEFDPRLLGQNG